MLCSLLNPTLATFRPISGGGGQNCTFIIFNPPMIKSFIRPSNDRYNLPDSLTIKIYLFNIIVFVLQKISKKILIFKNIFESFSDYFVTRCIGWWKLMMIYMFIICSVMIKKLSNKITGQKRVLFPRSNKIYCNEHSLFVKFEHIVRGSLNF